MKEGKDKFCGMTQTFVSVAAGARRNIVKNERNDSYWIPKQMYCPNCGTLSVGYKMQKEDRKPDEDFIDYMALLITRSQSKEWEEC